MLIINSNCRANRIQNKNITTTTSRRKNRISTTKKKNTKNNKNTKETKQKSKTPSKTGQQELKIEEKQTNTTLDSFQ